MPNAFLFGAHPAKNSMIIGEEICQALIASLVFTAAIASDVPYLTGRVVDNAEILKPETRARLTEEMKAHETATGNQIAVLTVTTLDGDSVEGYADKIFLAIVGKAEYGRFVLLGVGFFIVYMNVREDRIDKPGIKH